MVTCMGIIDGLYTLSLLGFNSGSAWFSDLNLMFPALNSSKTALFLVCSSTVLFNWYLGPLNFNEAEALPSPSLAVIVVYKTKFDKI